MDCLFPRATGTGLLLVIGLLAPGCDNPACVFSASGCNGSSGSVGENPASLPADGEWIAPSAPSIQKVFPASTTSADINTPVVLLFSESMTPENPAALPAGDLSTAFSLHTLTGGTVEFAHAALVGDGRMLILFPQLPLQPATSYTIVFEESALVVDRTGQTLPHPASGTLGTFGTAATPAASPTIVATWPQDSSTNQSGTTEIAVVFDRVVNPATVDTDSFAVTVDGNPPTFDPAPKPVSVGSAGSDNRGFVWRSVDGQGLVADLGESASVHVAWSPAGHEIREGAGAAVALTEIDFDTAPFSAPLSAAITSVPTDAIGIQQISGAADLAVQVLLSGAQAGDILVLTLFGGDPGAPVNPPLIALHREVALVAPFDAFTMTAAEIDLLAGSDPVRGRLADGTVAFAFQVRRGSISSPVRLLDVDTAETGVQSPELDTVPPRVIGLSTSGLATTSVRSDLRDVTLVGRATERLERAAVATPRGNNQIQPGVVPRVVGSAANGLFVAAPVRLGILAPADNPLDFTLTIYDRALNSATVQSDVLVSTDGFRQVGASGPGAALPGGTVDVEVFDAATLAPVAGAEVFVHQVSGGIVTAVNTVPELTGTTGLARVDAASSGTTLITVRRAGYEIFSLQGVPTSRLSIPLAPAGLAAGSVTGFVGPIDQATATDLNSYTRSVADSRTPENAPALFAVSICSAGGDPSSFTCPFGPIAVRPSRIGAESAVTVRVPVDIAFYSPLTFLKTAELVLPLSPVLPAGVGATSVPIPFLLDAGTLDPEELPIDAPAQALSTAAWPGLLGDPVVTIEALSPGIPGTVTVGQGVAFDDSPPAGSFVVRAAYPGSADGIQEVPADQLGSLVTEGTIDRDLLLGVQVVDTAGNRGGARPRFSRASGFLAPPAPPVLPASPISPNAGGEALDLTFPDVLPDAVSPPRDGIYRVTLTDSAGRSWTIYTPDIPDSAGTSLIVHLPELGGVFPLASGSAQCRISGWAWSALSFAVFLWSDIEREHDLSFHSAAQSLTIP